MNSSATGGMTPTSCTTSTCGSVLMTLTDAQGDLLSYVVTLTSLQLQTASGAAVETLPASTKIDFTQLVDLSELVTAGQIPQGEYTSAKITIDYTGATITADDGSGNAVQLQPVDSTGAALTTLTETVQLDSQHHLVITPGHLARLALDFNLAATNTVSLTAKTVTVTPTLVASIVPTDNKPLRVRGSLVSASASANDFVLNVTPFHMEKFSLGQITVDVSSTTTYQINGTSYIGSAGITALAAVPAGTMVAAFGTLQTGMTTPTFTATSVFAGTSLESMTQDRISGTVIARSGNALTVRGVTWQHRGDHDDDFEFDRADATVNVGSGTTVTEDGQTGSFSIADISVGQQIDAFGTASSSNGAVTLDATAGQVQLDITSAWGVVTQLGTGTMTLNLQALGGLDASVFNFAGTGTGSAGDATAAAYVINTQSLSQTGFAVNAPARVFGFVTPFAMAPPDFTAETLVNYSAVTDFLTISWGMSGSSTAFTALTASSTSLQLNLANVGQRHSIAIGPQRLDVTTLAMAPSIVPDTSSSMDAFTIAHGMSWKSENFTTFAAFVAQLASELTGSTTVIAVNASGHYDSTANAFTATHLVVVLNN